MLGLRSYTVEAKIGCGSRCADLIFSVELDACVRLVDADAYWHTAA